MICVFVFVLFSCSGAGGVREAVRHAGEVIRGGIKGVP